MLDGKSVPSGQARGAAIAAVAREATGHTQAALRLPPPQKTKQVCQFVVCIVVYNEDVFVPLQPLAGDVQSRRDTSKRTLTVPGHSAPLKRLLESPTVAHADRNKTLGNARK